MVPSEQEHIELQDLGSDLESGCIDLSDFDFSLSNQQSNEDHCEVRRHLLGQILPRDYSITSCEGRFE
jgi:hypothetical protein